MQKHQFTTNSPFQKNKEFQQFLHFAGLEHALRGSTHHRFPHDSAHTHQWLIVLEPGQPAELTQ